MADGAQCEFNATELDPALLSTPCRLRTHWHVITGAQSSGKTTLIEQLGDRGYQTVPEAARLYFERERDKGRGMDEILSDMAAVQRNIANVQIGLENALQATDIVFLDRALPECLTFHRVAGLDPNELLAECLRHRYASVFVLDRLPFHQDGLRDKIDISGDLLEEWIPRDYSALGYDVVSVPVLPPAERLAFVLDRLSDRGLL